MTRRYLSAKEKAEMLLAQNGRCAACGSKLAAPNIEYDHTVAGWLVEHREKPDRAICATPCHRDKTAKTDIPAIAKVKRLTKATDEHLNRLAEKYLGFMAEQPQPKPYSHRMQSRGFRKDVRKKMNGKVEPRLTAARAGRMG